MGDKALVACAPVTVHARAQMHAASSRTNFEMDSMLLKWYSQNFVDIHASFYVSSVFVPAVIAHMN